MQIKWQRTALQCLSPKNLTPWRDSNPRSLAETMNTTTRHHSGKRRFFFKKNRSLVVSAQLCNCFFYAEDLFQVSSHQKSWAAGNTPLPSKECVQYRVARWCIFIPKILNLGKFWRTLEWKMLAYLMNIWKILLPSGIRNSWPFALVSGHLVYFSRFGMFRPRKIWQPWPVYAPFFSPCPWLGHF
jgi:hypothetical protein